jgi:DNA-binding winged helix-turn-helix (wHTH) protein
MSKPVQQVYYFGGYVINLANRELLINGREVKVQKRVFDLLSYLIENRDRAVGKDELLDKIWVRRITTEAALTRAIMKARKAVGDDAHSQSVIKTLHGHGYRFVAQLQPVEEARQTSLTELRSNKQSTSRFSDLVQVHGLSSLIRYLVLLLMIAVIIISALGYFALD